MDNKKNKILNKSIRSICERHVDALPKLFNFFTQEKEQFDVVNLATLIYNLNKLIPRKIIHAETKHFTTYALKMDPLDP